MKFFFIWFISVLLVEVVTLFLFLFPKLYNFYNNVLGWDITFAEKYYLIRFWWNGFHTDLELEGRTISYIYNFKRPFQYRIKPSMMYYVNYTILNIFKPKIWTNVESSTNLFFLLFKQFITTMDNNDEIDMTDW